MLRSQQHPWLLGLALNGTDRFAVSRPALGVAAGLPQRRGWLPGCGPASYLSCSGLPPGPWSARIRDLDLAQVCHRAPVPGGLFPAVLGSKCCCSHRAHTSHHTSQGRQESGSTGTGLWLNVAGAVGWADWFEATWSPLLECRGPSLGKE